MELFIASNTSRSLREMSNLLKADTGLPVNLWLDEGQEYLKGKHGKRIKFQLNKARKVQKENFASISLVTGKVVDLGKVLKQKNCELKIREIKQVENFVQNNLFVLSAIEDKLIDTRKFLPLLIKGGDLKLDSDRKDLNNLVCAQLIQNILDQKYEANQLLDAKTLISSVYNQKDLIQNFGFSFKDVKNV